LDSHDGCVKAQLFLIIDWALLASCFSILAVMVVKAFGVLDNDDGSSQLTVSEHIQFYTTMISIDHEAGY